MNTRLTALALTAATALSFTPQSALAGDKEWAAVGGFLGGLIVGSVINDHDHDRGYRTSRTVIIDRDRHGGCNDRCDDRCEHRGYWKSVEIRTWVPDCWETRYERGRRVRIFIPGHYECRTDRVWVAYDRHDRHDRYGRSGRYGRGYGRDDCR
jgi:hypothetical protein